MQKNQAKWREILLELKRGLLEIDDDSSSSRGTVELDQTRVGRLSRIDALQEQAMNNAISERRKTTLCRIDAALERLNIDEFGYCLNCGEEISEKRLEIDPTTPLCIGCSK
ncbi:MAG: TraR/DksA C4-type zinc finger protein [Alphaproteobacteria bacterium]|nr:TraR/DksA C4-type zinc finger protein [Alphaproteobacteria bacterium]